MIGKITGLEIYSKKQRWKLYLLAFAALIVIASLYYTDTMVRKIERDERQRVELWAEAIQKRETLLQENERLFDVIQAEEQKRVDLLRQVYGRLGRENYGGEELTFYTNILESNTTIPLVMTDEGGEILSDNNLDSRFFDENNRLKYDYLEGELADYFSRYPPMTFTIIDGQRFIYYQDSRVFTEIQDVMRDLTDSFLSDIVINSANVPVIVVDSQGSELIAHGNIEGVDFDKEEEVSRLIETMTGRTRFLSVSLPTYGQCYVYYSSSLLLTQLRYYPVFQFLLIGIFLFVSYMLFSIARNAEQNQVWVGMSKETAHQLGTPLSSLMAWLEILRMKGLDDDTIQEISKDVKRLENITERFSKIGSTPRLDEKDITASVNEVVEYMKKRSPKKVSFMVAAPEKYVVVPHNPNLFGWVIENLLKNAIDAMHGSGRVYITIDDNPGQVIVDVSDDGKGIPHNKHKTIFNPGYTSKKSGWGLGLSLSKRIIEHYHGGKLFVRHSAKNSGTTFRIILNK